jgi:hypothetical protein
MSREELLAKAKLYLVLHGNDYTILSKLCSDVCKHYKKCGGGNTMRVLYSVEESEKSFCVKWMDDE